MRRFLIALSALLIGGAMIVEDAEARRLGGARSSGVQRNATTTPPASTPAKPAQQQPAAGQPAAGQQQAAPAAGAAAPASGLAKWGPLLGGLAIGGLLGSLFSGSGLGGILLLALLAVAAVMVFRMLARRHQPQQTMQYAGTNERVSVPQPRAMAAGSAPVAAAGPAVPADFDTAGFLRGAKLNFVKLQVANDAGNLEEIREFTTPELFEVLAKDVAERGGARQQTDVMSLNAELVEVTTEGDRHWASIRFSGLVREAPGTDPVEFQEVWNLAKPADGSTGWLLAGIQQLQ